MENDNFYKNFNSKKDSYFKNNFIMPFISGILGTSLVIGICFGIPNIRTQLINTSNKSSLIQTSANSENNIGNLDQVSLSNYTDTAVYASNKVLPSIVGISVEFNVTSNSLFGGAQTSTGAAEGSRNCYN